MFCFVVTAHSRVGSRPSFRLVALTRYDRPEPAVIHAVPDMLNPSTGPSLPKVVIDHGPSEVVVDCAEKMAALKFLYSTKSCKDWGIPNPVTLKMRTTRGIVACGSPEETGSPTGGGFCTPRLGCVLSVLFLVLFGASSSDDSGHKKEVV